MILDSKYLEECFSDEAKEDLFGIKPATDNLVEESAAEVDFFSEPLLEEFTEEDRAKNAKLKPVFVVNTYTNSEFGELMKKSLKSKYSHALISTNSNLSPMYSFDDKKEIINSKSGTGLATDNLKRYKDHYPEGDMRVTVLLVPPHVYKGITNSIAYYKKRERNTKYSDINLLRWVVGSNKISSWGQMQMFCSEFTDTILKHNNIDITGKSSRNSAPDDLGMYTDKNNFFVIFEGKIKDYDPEKIDKEIEKRKNTIEHKMLNAMTEKSMKKREDINLGKENHAGKMIKNLAKDKIDSLKGKKATSESAYDDIFSAPLFPFNETATEEVPAANIANGIAEVKETEDYVNPSDQETVLAKDCRELDDLIDLCTKDAASCSVITVPVEEALINAGVYREYLESVIDNEKRIQKALLGYGINNTSYTESSLEVLTEAGRIQENVSKRWDTFMKWINGIMDRFLAAIDKIINNNKGYLEKYKDIILNKPGREDMEYSYNGDYKEAVTRCNTVYLPEFNYERDAPFLRQEGYEAAVKSFMSGKNFNFKEDEDLAKQFKNWFLAAERGETKGKFSNLNFKEMYTICYDFDSKLGASVKKDKSILDRTKNSLLNAVNKIAREKGENPNEPKTTTNQQASTTGSGASDSTKNATNVNNASSAQTNTEENANAIINGGMWMNLSEADGDNNEPKAGNTGLQITSNDTEKKDANGNTATDNTGEPKKSSSPSTTEQDAINIVTKWTTICRAFNTGKLTAIQQISKDYMAIIQAHVRSYGGKGSKSEENEAENKQQSPVDNGNNTDNKNNAEKK